MVDPAVRQPDARHDGQSDASLPEHPGGRHDAAVLAFPSLGRRAPDTVDPPPAPRLRSVIGDVLRQERQDQARTLADVARRAAVSLPYLSEVERGTKDVSSDLLGAICDALDLDMADLLERTAHRLRTSTRRGPEALALAA